MIVPSGGTGQRMGGGLPKQYREVAGLPLLVHTLLAIAPIVDHILIAAAPEYIAFCEQWAAKVLLLDKVTVVAGGATRFESVQKALDALASTKQLDHNDWVGVHDAVRPLVSKEVIAQCFEASTQRGAAVPAKPLYDSLRVEQNNQFVPLSRDKVRAISTPQCFCAPKLLASYRQPYSPTFTDDLSVYETRYPGQFVLVPDTLQNIKITTQEDWQFLQYILTQRNNFPLTSQ